MTSLNIVVFVGSARDNRLGSRVLTFMRKKLKETQHEVTVFDPAVMKFEILTRPLHYYEDKSDAPEWLQNAGKQIKEADAFLIITPEYNASVPPALSNMLDHFPQHSFAYKPTAICTYSPGIFGGVRCSVALRAFLNELGSIPVPYGLSIPSVTDNIDAEGTSINDSVDAKAVKLLENLAWYGTATKKQRKEGTPQYTYINGTVE